jgi:hypothetical protein
MARGSGMAVSLQFWFMGTFMLIIGIFEYALAAVLIPFGVLTMFLGLVFGVVRAGRGR